MHNATTLPVAPPWAQHRASLRPAIRMVQCSPQPSLMRRVIDGAAFAAVVTAAYIAILALGAALDA